MLQRLKWACIVIALALAPVLTMDDSVQAQRAQVGYVQQGIASWYGPRFHGRDTASGERFDQNELTAAHRTLPLGTKAMVTNICGTVRRSRSRSTTVAHMLVGASSIFRRRQRSA